MPKEIIKKHLDQNEYLLTPDKLWVRNFRNETAGLDINNLMSRQECDLILSNELTNQKKKYPDIDSENVIKRKVLIVSDGYDFTEKHKALSKLPQDVCIIGVNKALSKWNLVGDACKPEDKRSMGFYLINNPYPEASSFLPRKTKYYPRCIASTRANSAFLSNYGNVIYGYSPVEEAFYSGPDFNYTYKVDDYRNPIVAAIGLAYRFKVEKICLLCCDDSFDDKRSGAVQLDNGKWTYEQHLRSSNLIDASLYWLAKDEEVKIANCSMGPKLKNAAYINLEDIIHFFEDNNGQ